MPRIRRLLDDKPPNAGNLGSERVTIQNLDVVKIDAENNLIAIKGAIPGPKKGIVMVVNSVKKA